MFDYIEYTVCDCFLSALFYGDYSGLDDEEDKKVADFLTKVSNDVDDKDYHISIVEESENFSICNICNLRGDTVNIRVHFKN